MTDAEDLARIDLPDSRPCGSSDRQSPVQSMLHTTEKATRHGRAWHRVRVKHHIEAAGLTLVSIDLTQCSLLCHEILTGDCHIGTSSRGR